MKKYTTKTIGDKGEEHAVHYLKKCGYKILERNYRRFCGEIDIIAKNKEYLVFVEVKTRKQNPFAEPSYAVNFNKQQHLRNTAETYIDENDLDVPCRFDVCEVLVNSDNLKLVNINYIEDAF